MTDQRRSHYFPAQDQRVITALTGKGEFVAFREEEQTPRGYGHSRMAAIADLNKAIEAVGSIYEREDETLQLAAE